MENELQHKLFEFETTRDLLRHLRENYPGRRRKLSLDELAAKLGYRSARTIGMILAGERPPTGQLTDALAADLQLDSLQKRWLELVAKRDRAVLKNNLRLKSVAEKELLALSPRVSKYIQISTETLQLLSRWYVWAVLQLVRTRGFDPNPNAIAKRLRQKITPEQAREAVEILLSLRLIAKRDGKLFKVDERGHFTGQNVPSKTIRKLHREMMERALEAIEEQGVLERHLTSLTLAMEKTQVLRVKKRIQAFVDELNAEFSQEGGDSVYQLNLQFFEHT